MRLLTHRAQAVMMISLAAFAAYVGNAPPAFAQLGYVGQKPLKFTYLMSDVEVEGTVFAFKDGPGGDSIEIEPDVNYKHLVALMPGNNPLAWFPKAKNPSRGMIHLETYPLKPQESNRLQPWRLAQKSDGLEFTVSNAAPGSDPRLNVGDRVRVVGQWVIDHHPEVNWKEGLANGNPGRAIRLLGIGALRIGNAHMELHPFDWQNIQRVIEPQPSQKREQTVSVAAPIHDEVFLGNGKWLANDAAGVAGRVYITRNGATYHNTVTADAHVRAPDLPRGFTASAPLIIFEEIILQNSPEAQKNVSIVPDGIRVKVTVAPPLSVKAGGLGDPFRKLTIADLNAPANKSGIFQARYKVGWLPRLDLVNEAGTPVTRIDISTQAFAPKYFTMSFINRGPDPLQIGHLEFEGSGRSAFQVASQHSTIPPTGVPYGFEATFAPEVQGTFDVKFVMRSNDPAMPEKRIEVRGVAQGSAPALAAWVEPQRLDWGAQQITVHAEDKHTHVPLDGKVRIVISGQPEVEGRTNTPFSVTLHPATAVRHRSGFLVVVPPQAHIVNLPAPYPETRVDLTPLLPTASPFPVPPR
ncbi:MULTISPECIES: hypothetical protein [unclassified Bradyrhizobium]|uniref:hypothetical protein n=1 Tax=unclassified Bradyrhizobium TaxID=2631580 RepID=UPI003391920C